MDFKPNEFFIGLVEFITILLPGAVLALIILLVEANHSLPDKDPLYEYAFADNKNILFWVAFILSTFGLGYFLSSIASGLDHLYDAVRKQFYPYEEDLKERFNYNCLSEKQKDEYLKIYEQTLIDRQKKKCAKNEMGSQLEEIDKIYEGYKIKFSKNILRMLLALIFKLDFNIKLDKSYDEARRILNNQPEAVRNASNTYKWAYTILEAHFPANSEQVTRIMSASKFFRSIVVVSFIFLTLQVFGQVSFSFWQINLLFLLLSFREFIVQRQKSVQKTYQSIVTLTYFKKDNVEIN